MTHTERTAQDMKNPMQFSKSWWNFGPEKCPNIFLHRPSAFYRHSHHPQNLWNWSKIVPPIYINRIMIFFRKKATWPFFFWSKKDMNLRFSASSRQFQGDGNVFGPIFQSCLVWLKSDVIERWLANFSLNFAKNRRKTWKFEIFAPDKSLYHAKFMQYTG